MRARCAARRQGRPTAEGCRVMFEVGSGSVVFGAPLVVTLPPPCRGPRLLPTRPMTPALDDTWPGSILANRGRIHRAASAAWIIRAVSTDAEWFEVCAASADIVAELSAVALRELIDAARGALLAAEVVAEAEAIIATPYIFAATDADAAAMAPSRGLPGRCSAMKDPCESANRNRNQPSQLEREHRT